MVLFYTLHTTKRRRNMKKQGFGTTKDGKEALLYTLSNKNGMEISVTDYGAHLVSVLVPDKDGKKRDVVLGFDSVTGYETDGSHFGATIGRNGNVSREQHLNCTEKHTSWQKMRTTTTCTAARTDTITASGT